MYSMLANNKAPQAGLYCCLDNGQTAIVQSIRGNAPCLHRNAP